MKNLLIAVCFIGAVCGISADAAPGKALSERPEQTTIVTRSELKGNLTYASHTSVTAERIEAVSEKPKPRLQLLSVNGVSLYDSRQDVIRKLGEPLSTEKDELLAGMEMLHYPFMTIYLIGESIDFVEVAHTAERIVVDDVELLATEASIKEAFGEPDFVAEDGIVFIRNGFALKLFLDETTRDLTSITYF